MQKNKVLYLIGLVVLLAGSSVGYSEAQEPQSVSIGNLTGNTIVIVVGVSAFGGLVKMLLPFARKYQRRLEEIENYKGDIEDKPKPLEFQKSYLMAWIIALPLGTIAAIGYAAAMDVVSGLGLVINAFVWGITANWFTSEAVS